MKSYKKAIIIILLSLSLKSTACTISIIDGSVTVDGRPIMWKIRHPDLTTPMILGYRSGAATGHKYNRVVVSGTGFGLNEKGMASGNTGADLYDPNHPDVPAGEDYNVADLSSLPPEILATTDENSIGNGDIVSYILGDCANTNEVRSYIDSIVSTGQSTAQGCFPSVDSSGGASIFEVYHSLWYIEYAALDPDRLLQNLLGFVVRATEFHEHPDGTDNIDIIGRYNSATYNTKQLINSNQLSVQKLIQGTSEPNTGIEVIRYGPYRDLITIADNENRCAMVVHGVLPGEDPNLSTMWVMLGNTNYTIAVPIWVKVTNTPTHLSTSDMWDRAMSLFNKGQELTVQATTIPFEAHLFKLVDDKFLPRWRAKGFPSKTEVTRIERRLADDAYTVLNCLDNVQFDNKAPEISFSCIPEYLTLNFSLNAFDSDGYISSVIWNFGDSQDSNAFNPSHTYSLPGTYLVSCTITDDDGISITDYDYFTVHDVFTGPTHFDIAGEDNFVDIWDFFVLLKHWLDDCGERDWCEGADFNHDEIVDGIDFSILADKWLTTVD
jgi:hypothetical protein